MPAARVLRISAVTLAVSDMARSIGFFRTLGFRVTFGGSEAPFSTLRAGDAIINLSTERRPCDGFWGRVVIHVDDVDAHYGAVVAAGLQPSSEPRDASWGERFYHILDPDGHELSFAAPL